MRRLGEPIPSYNSPPQTNSGYFARFNDNSERSAYTSDRTNFGVGVKLKPALLGDIAAIDLNYEGYQRDGNRFSPWIAGGSDFTGSQVQLQRWRGFDQPIDESVGKVALDLTLSPGGSFNFAYAGCDRGVQQSGAARSPSVTSHLPFRLATRSAAPTAPSRSTSFPTASCHAQAAALEELRPVRDRGGLRHSLLEQDSFTQRQQAAGYSTGEISGQNGFFNFTSRLTPSTTLEAHLKYTNRDNDSTFPATGLISATADQQLGVRINSLEGFEYAVEAAFRPVGRRTSWTAGWKREDISRDLTFHVSPGIIAQRSLYSEESLSDEIYLKFVSRPGQGWTVRITPSYLQADETGLITEPEESFNLKTFASYVTPGGTMLSAYYNYKDEQNSNKNYTNAVAPTGATVPGWARTSRRL